MWNVVMSKPLALEFVSDIAIQIKNCNILYILLYYRKMTEKEEVAMLHQTKNSQIADLQKQFEGQNTLFAAYSSLISGDNKDLKKIIAILSDSDLDKILGIYAKIKIEPKELLDIYAKNKIEPKKKNEEPKKTSKTSFVKTFQEFSSSLLFGKEETEIKKEVSERAKKEEKVFLLISVHDKLFVPNTYQYLCEFFLYDASKYIRFASKFSVNIIVYLFFNNIIFYIVVGILLDSTVLNSRIRQTFFIFCEIVIQQVPALWYLAKPAKEIIEYWQEKNIVNEIKKLNLSVNLIYSTLNNLENISKEYWDMHIQPHVNKYNQLYENIFSINSKLTQNDKCSCQGPLRSIHKNLLNLSSKMITGTNVSTKKIYGKNSLKTFVDEDFKGCNDDAPKPSYKIFYGIMVGIAVFIMLRLFGSVKRKSRKLETEKNAAKEQIRSIFKKAILTYFSSEHDKLFKTKDSLERHYGSFIRVVDEDHNNKSFNLSIISTELTVKTVKELIESEKEYEKESQIIKFNDTPMEDNISLKSYGVKIGDTIHLQVKAKYTIFYKLGESVTVYTGSMKNGASVSDIKTAAVKAYNSIFHDKTSLYWNNAQQDDASLIKTDAVLCTSKEFCPITKPSFLGGRNSRRIHSGSNIISKTRKHY